MLNFFSCEMTKLFETELLSNTIYFLHFVGTGLSVPPIAARGPSSTTTDYSPGGDPKDYNEATVGGGHRPADDRHHELPPEVAQSCIGVKRRCVQPPPSPMQIFNEAGGDDELDDETRSPTSASSSGTSCSRSLTEYKIYCREDKKLNQCVSTDW
jgi:hypothetical protein